MFTTEIDSISELERIAYLTDNQAALQILSKLDTIVNCLEALKAENVSHIEIEYMRLVCGLENNFKIA